MLVRGRYLRGEGNGDFKGVNGVQSARSAGKWGPNRGERRGQGVKWKLGGTKVTKGGEIWMV